jgi:WS/DGAT/MGAT family acyltransferase
MTRERFNYQDAGLVNFDRNRYPHNIGSVGILEGTVAFDEYLAHVDERLNLVPRYRQRMVRAAWDLATPAWHDDPDFDVRRHVRSATLPGPGEEDQLRRLAGEFFAEPLDRGRPLWEILLVQGLRGGRTAQLVKAHHCLVDGVGGVQLLIALLDTAPEPTMRPRGFTYSPEPPPHRLAHVIDSVFDRLDDELYAAERLVLTALDPKSALGWFKAVGRALWTARPYLVRTAPDTPWNTKLSAPRRLAWQNIPLEETRAICSARGGKVNDVVLTILAGAFQRYFLLHGWETEGVVLRVVVPVNERNAAEANALGNHVSIMIAGLPLGISDPLARLRVISNEMKSLKEADQAGGLADVLRFFGHLPEPVQVSLGRRMTAPNIVANLLCTNVRGPETPLYCLGHQMVAHYPWVLTTWRMGLSVAVMSYMKNLSFSFTGDAAVLPDIERLSEFLEADFWELYRETGLPSPKAAPLSVGGPREVVETKLTAPSAAGPRLEADDVAAVGYGVP